jgi:hypothetical protein
MDDTDLLTAVRVRRELRPKLPEGDDGADELVGEGDAYACVKGQRVASAIEFIPRDGDPFIIPYGYLPLLWPKRPDTLLVEYPTLFTVQLQGKHLDVLKQRIRDQRVIWIRACDEVTAARLPVAVTRIEILRAYPSREAGSDGGES